MPGTRPPRRRRRVAREPRAREARWRASSSGRPWRSGRVADPAGVGVYLRLVRRAGCGLRAGRWRRTAAARRTRPASWNRRSEQALLVDRRVGPRVAAVPVGPHAELLQGPVHRPAQPRPRAVHAEVVVEEVLLVGVGALLLHRTVAVGLRAELRDEDRLARIAGAHRVEVVGQRVAVGDLAVGPGIPAEVVVDADDVERRVLRPAAGRRIAGDGEPDRSRGVQRLGRRPRARCRTAAPGPAAPTARCRSTTA